MPEEKVPNCPICDSKEQAFIYKDRESSSYVRCGQCGVVFQNPRKITVYKDDYWKEALVDPDGIIRHHENEKDHYIKNLYGHVLRFVDKLEGGNVLDAGCGYAYFLLALSKKKWVKYGLDSAVSLVEHIKKSHADINIYQGNLEDDVFKPDYFDLVFSSNVIEHVVKPELVIRQFNRITKANGTLIITTANIESFCARRFRGNYRMLCGPHIVMFSPATLKRLLESNGFKVFKTEYPYFRTKYFTVGNIARMFDTSKVSPPFYGNLMTLYARKV